MLAVVMSWGNSDGTQGRCDARCHNAQEPRCECMCGGAFHGAGLDGSLERKVEAHWSELVERLEGAGTLRPHQGALL